MARILSDEFSWRRHADARRQILIPLSDLAFFPEDLSGEFTETAVNRFCLSKTKATLLNSENSVFVSLFVVSLIRAGFHCAQA